MVRAAENQSSAKGWMRFIRGTEYLLLHPGAALKLTEIAGGVCEPGSIPPASPHTPDTGTPGGAGTAKQKGRMRNRRNKSYFWGTQE